ncbi:hypothetical protein [Dysgonomonas reticulitermitis]
MKHPFNLLFLSFFLFLFSCSNQVEDELGSDDTQESLSPTKSISLGLSKSSLEIFQSYGITELSIYAYLNDSVVYGKTLPLNNGNLKIEVPLGENLKTFAIANAGQITDSGSLSTITIYQDYENQKEIFISDIVSFMSDKSVDTVKLELKRVVGQAVLQPTESSTELSAVTNFDALNVIFNNVFVAYMPGANKYVLGNVTINTKLSDGYKASAYSFPTQGENFGSIEIIYLKSNTEVNKTIRPLDVAIKYEISKRTVVNMPILDEDYLEKSFSVALKAVKSTQKITVQEYQF